MYLSRVLLTGNNLRNPYELHRMLWRLFPSSAKNQQRDFLFRIEQKNNRQAQILLQSQREPISETSGYKILACKDITIKPELNSRLRFFVYGNPVKTIKDEHGRTNSKGEPLKCRVPLIDDAELHHWMERKLKNAANLEFLEIEKQTPLYFKKSKHNGKIQPYIFKGVMQVTNKEHLAQLIESGVGPAKSFGCGLLSLAKV